MHWVHTWLGLTARLHIAHAGTTVKRQMSAWLPLADMARRLTLPSSACLHLLVMLVMLLIFAVAVQCVDYNAHPGDVRRMVQLEERLAADFDNLTDRQRSVVDSVGRYDAGHPLDIYWLFKHWVSIRETFGDPDRLVGTADLTRFVTDLPEDKDWKYVGLSILRLQQVYQVIDLDDRNCIFDTKETN